MYVTIPEVNEIAAGVRDKLRLEFIREHVDEVLKGNHSSKFASTLYKRQILLLNKTFIALTRCLHK